MNRKTIFIGSILLLAVPHPALAAGHDGMMMQEGEKQEMGSKPGAFLEQKDIDGYMVSFHVMTAKPGKEMGGTHDFMVKVEQDGKSVDVLAANSKVKYPDGKEESKMMMKMGDWYMAGYDLGHEGDNQLMVLFKTADGKKHFGGVHYPR